MHSLTHTAVQCIWIYECAQITSYRRVHPCDIQKSFSLSPRSPRRKLWKGKMSCWNALDWSIRPYVDNLRVPSSIFSWSPCVRACLCAFERCCSWSVVLILLDRFRRGLCPTGRKEGRKEEGRKKKKKWREQIVRRVSIPLDIKLPFRLSHS